MTQWQSHSAFNQIIAFLTTKKYSRRKQNPTQKVGFFVGNYYIPRIYDTYIKVYFFEEDYGRHY
jgi:hypothetical protein